MLEVKDNHVVLKINPRLYTLEAVHSASYVFLDRAYIILDGEPDTEIKVILSPKGSMDMEKLGLEFCNELINYSDYLRRSADTRKVREAIVQRALITNQVADEFDQLLKEVEDIEIDDPEGIAIPWEEKYKK
jgi:His-Xaa-Ser system protein HxsD